MSRLYGMFTIASWDQTVWSLWLMSGQVHEGFQLACSRNIDTILTDLKVLKKNYPDYKIMITGHSLGGMTLLLLHICTFTDLHTGAETGTWIHNGVSYCC